MRKRVESRPTPKVRDCMYVGNAEEKKTRAQKANRGKCFITKSKSRGSLQHSPAGGAVIFILTEASDSEPFLHVVV